MKKARLKCNISMTLSEFVKANTIQAIGLTYGYNIPIGPIESLTFLNLGYWF